MMNTKTIRFSKFVITLLILISIVTITGCMTPAPTIKPSSPVPQQAAFNVLPFSAITIDGQIHVILNGKQSHQGVIVMAPPNTAKSVTISVNKNTLMLRGSSFTVNNHVSPLVIQINMTQPLTNVTIHGSSTVTAQSIGNPNLDFNLQDSANLTFKGGDIQLHSIINNGRGSVVIQGIHSNTVIVRGNGRGKVDLSGQTDELNVQIGNSLTLYAHTLFANKAHVITQNKALAFVCPVAALYGFAYDDSNIYYYHNNPGSVVRDTYISGNVLKMPK